MSDESSHPNRLGSLTTGLAILVLVALVCVIASVLFSTRFVQYTVGIVVQNLAERSGISIFLVKFVVIIGSIPFFWAVGKFTSNIWGLLNLGWDSLSFYKNKYGIIIVGYVGIYFLAMYVASIDAYAYKYCADTPEGIWTSDSPGKDPVYGIEVQPCSQSQRLELRYKFGHLKPAREISINDADNFEWFDPVTGSPRVWYSTGTDYGFRFFDAYGVDPHNRQELKPVTPGIVDTLKRQQASQAAARKEADDEAKEAQLKAAADARQTQEQSETDALARQAQSAFASKDFKSAYDTCSQVLKTAAGNQDCATTKRRASIKLAQELVVKGQAHFEKGEFDEAIWSAEQALDLDPNNPTAQKLKKLATEMKVH